MAKISVITPTNSLKWFHLARLSMENQSLKDWEWIVLWNGDEYEHSNDERIKCVRSMIGSQNVGALKREACMNCTSPYIVEFDHDDELHPECLAEVLACFEATKAAFVYSDDAQTDLQTGRPYLYGASYGWNTYEVKWNHGAQVVFANHRPLLLPQNLSRIWYAPDHVRAWTREGYWQAGGHNTGLKVLDDQDLMTRLYLTSGGKFAHIPKCLYKHVVHGGNTWLQNSDDIQRLTLQMHDESIESLALAHWKKEGKRCIDLGGGIDSPVGWESCDTHDAAVMANLDERWPFEDNSVGVFRAHDIIEHLRNPIHTMNEAWRCLVHGGLFLIEVPSTDGRGAFQDPTHVSFWNSNSMWYYCREQQQRYIKHAGIACQFQAVRVLDHFPSPWHQTNQIPYVRAHLAAIKSGPTLHGLNGFSASK